MFFIFSFVCIPTFIVQNEYMYILHAYGYISTILFKYHRKWPQFLLTQHQNWHLIHSVYSYVCTFKSIVSIEQHKWSFFSSIFIIHIRNANWHETANHNGTQLNFISYLLTFSLSSCCVFLLLQSKARILFRFYRHYHHHNRYICDHHDQPHGIINININNIGIICK